MRLKFARTFRLLRKIKISKKSIRVIFKLPAFNYKNALYFFNILKYELIKLLFNLFHCHEAGSLNREDILKDSIYLSLSLFYRFYRS